MQHHIVTLKVVYMLTRMTHPNATLAFFLFGAIVLELLKDYNK